MVCEFVKFYLVDLDLRFTFSGNSLNGISKRDIITDREALRGDCLVLRFPLVSRDILFSGLDGFVPSFLTV
jgi:hypothetical protein